MYTGFAVVAEFVRDLILGMVAGLMTTISMSLNGGDQEAQWRLRALSAWMQHKQLPKSFQMPMKEYCHELWCSASGASTTRAGRVNTDELFNELPPMMRSHLTNFLYGACPACLCAPLPLCCHRCASTLSMLNVLLPLLLLPLSQARPCPAYRSFAASPSRYSLDYAVTQWAST